MKHFFLPLVLIAVSLVSCRSIKNAGNDGESISYKMIDQGSLMGGGEEGIDESVVVCNSQSELDAIKEKMNSVNPSTQELDKLEVDFKKQTVIGYFQPVRSSGGYSSDVIDFTRINEDGIKKYLLRIEVSAPQGPAISVITQPYVFLVTEKVEAEVEFQTNEL